MGQQLCDLAVLLCGQPHQDILEVGVRVMPVKPGALDQAHDGSGALAGAQRSGEQPVRAAHGKLRVILPMSGKKLKSSIAGIRCMDVASGANTASSVPTAR